MSLKDFNKILLFMVNNNFSKFRKSNFDQLCAITIVMVTPETFYNSVLLKMLNFYFIFIFLLQRII